MNLLLSDNICFNDNETLMNIVNNDTLLRKEMGLTKFYKTVEEFEEIGKRWANSVNGSIFTITYNNCIVGVASLSKIENQTQSSNFGFWIKSEYWNTEIENKAFSLLCEKAKSIGINKFRERKFDNTEIRVITKCGLCREGNELII